MAQPTIKYCFVIKNTGTATKPRARQVGTLMPMDGRSVTPHSVAQTDVGWGGVTGRGATSTTGSTYDFVRIYLFERHRE